MTELAQSWQDAAKALHRYADQADQEALDECLGICLEPAYRQAYADLGHDADAQDAAQEALLQLVRSAKHYDASRPLAPWLARHVTFACAHVRRSAARRRRREEIAMQEQLRLQTSEAAEDTNELELEKVRAALSHLKEKDRAIISMHYFAGLSQAETAESLGISENAASVRIHRARTKLKNILEKQGIASSFVLLPVLAQNVPTMPTQLLPQVVQCCSASVLPTTTISLTLAEKGIMIMQAHPLLTAASALLLSAASFSGAMLMSAEKESPTPAPRVQVEEAPDKALKKWNPKAQKVLAYHDPNALFQLASDGPALRELILATKPFNHLRTEKGQALVSAWWKSVEHYKNWTRRDSEALALFDAWLRHQGTLFQMDSLPRQILWAVDAGDHTVDSKRILGDLAEQERRIRKQHGMKVQQTRITEENDVFRVGMGVPFEAEKQAPSVELQQHALWLRINPKKLIKKLAETEGLPYDVAHYLGTDWEKRAVSLAMNLDKEGDELKIDGVIDGLQPSVFWLGAIIFNEYILRNQDIPVAPLRLQVPKMLPAPDAQALVELRFGCDYQQHDLLKKALVQILNDEAKLGSLATVWNGELLFRLQRGIPFPSPELVLGLQDGGHVQLAAELNAVLVQLGAQEQKPSTGYEKEWTLYAPTGIMQIGLAEDRIVVASSLKMKAMAERVDSQDGFSLVMDLPTLGQSYLPLLWPQIPQKMVPNDNSGLNSQFTLSHHITANIRNAKRTGESIDSAINKAGHDEEARLWFGKDGVNDFNLNEYVSVWKGALNQNGHKYDRTHIIYRTESGWHFFRDPDFWGMSPAREELVSVQKHLKGFKHIGGAALNDIKLHPRGSVPTIDAQSHYPDLATTISLLPRYKLTCNRNDQGQQVFTEQGLPCMGLIIGAAGLGLMEVDPEEEAKDYQKLQDQAAVFALHKDRIDAMKNITLAMKNKKWEKPSDILEHAKKADIAQLGLGDNPSAAEINELGLWAKDFGFDHVLVDTKIDLKARYQHKRFLLQKWSVPLDDDHWVHIGLHHNVGVTFDGPGFDGRSYTDQQKVKKRKQKPKRQKEQAPEDIEF